VFGSHPVAGELLNAVLGALLVPVVYIAARRWLGRPEARFSAVAVALLPGPIFFTDVLLTETLYTLMLAGFAALLAVPRRDLAYCGLLGVVVGLAALVRGEGLILLVVTPLVWWGQVPVRQLVRQWAVVVVVTAVVMTPWVVRNQQQLHAFIPTGVNTGTTIWSGHNPDASGYATFLPHELVARYDKLGPVEQDLKIDRFLRRQAVDYAANHPLRELVLIPQKLIAFAEGDGATITTWVNAGRHPPALSVTATRRFRTIGDIGWFTLLAGTILSLALFGRRLWRNPLLRVSMVYLAVALVLYGFVFYGNFRYHVPFEPLMVFLLAPLAVRLPRLKASGADASTLE
jgi:4-amino-4-deoxy-L-arabinose transferase-like glycosyltransferase